VPIWQLNLLSRHAESDFHVQYNAPSPSS
jgi:hypothetical protein